MGIKRRRPSRIRPGRVTVKGLKAKANATLSQAQGTLAQANYALAEVLDGVTVSAEVDMPAMTKMMIAAVSGKKSKAKWQELPIRFKIEIEE